MPRTKKDVKKRRHDYLVSLEKAQQEKKAARAALRAENPPQHRDVKMKERESTRDKIARKAREARERRAPKKVSEVVMKVKKTGISKH